MTDDAILSTFTLATFAPRIGEVFRIAGLADGAVETRLIEATAGAAGPSRDQFSLVFQTAPGETDFEQGLYPVEHQGLGLFELFLVPIGPDPGGMRYEAVFT